MYQEVSKLLMYGENFDSDEILFALAELIGEYENSKADGRLSDLSVRTELIRGINYQVKRLLEVATSFGFDENLWQNYLTFFLMMSENPFSMTCEKVGASEGTVNELVRGDFRIIKTLFDYDFTEIEADLGIRCFHFITHYKAIAKKDLMYNKNVSSKVRTLSRQLAQAVDENEFFDAVTAFYRDYGVGMFGLNKAFRIGVTAENRMEFLPINNMDAVTLEDLVGYEIQKQKLIDNTASFVAGRPANNVLLFGDSGTGKSTSIKAIVNQYYDDGLRMIEIYKHQFKYLSQIIAEIKNRNYRFIIYMDDLSFEEHEIEYKFLKAVIEGGVETRPDNILIYATSNRRHLIKETWNDRNDTDHTNDRHHSDTVEEKLSLVNRFGVTINFSKPTQKEFFQIVTELAKKAGISMTEEELCAKANAWELAHGGISGRTAQQFINYLEGQEL